MAFMAFDENHSFRDFRVSVIIYCPCPWSTASATSTSRLLLLL